MREEDAVGGPAAHIERQLARLEVLLFGDEVLTLDEGAAGDFGHSGLLHEGRCISDSPPYVVCMGPLQMVIANVAV